MLLKTENIKTWVEATSYPADKTGQNITPEHKRASDWY